MLDSPMAPYLLWAKSREPAPIDLAGSNLLHCTFDDLPGARDAVDLNAPNSNGYAPLGESIAEHYGVSADRVAMAQGCSGANFIVAAALVGAGDEVLIEYPTYDPLIGACRLMGGRIRHFNRPEESGWTLDLDDIKQQLSSHTRLIVITNPHNPSGALLDVDQVQALGALAESAGAHVLVDEVYLDGSLMLRPGEARQPAATLDGPFISTSSLTKSYGLGGLRCGWVIASANTAERLRRTRDVVDNANSGPADLLAHFAFSQLDRLTARTTALLSANVELVRTFFADHPELALATPPGASIVFPRITSMPDARAFIQSLLDNHGVAVAPGDFFDCPGHFRLSLSGQTDQLAEGLTRIGLALSSK